jgi:hypothetical protein
VAGLTTEELRFAVWFVSAGFVAGFALSTLWEWLYGRSRRLTVETLVSGAEGGAPLTRPLPPPIPSAESCAVLDFERTVRPLQWLDDQTLLGAFEPFEAPSKATIQANGVTAAAGLQGR